MSDFSTRLNQLANYLWQLAPGTETLLDPDKLKLVAHRGAHGYGPKGFLIENTLAAFDRCLEAKIWGIELDVHLTKDHQLVVHHDPHCGRLFHRPDLVIKETSLAQLRREVPQIPLLSEVIERYSTTMHLMIEVKVSWREQPQIVDQLLSALSSLTPEKDFHLLSLEPDYLTGFTDLPHSALMDVAEFNTQAIMRQNRQLGHGAIAGSFALFTSKRVKALQAAGVKVGTGMVEHPAIVRREISRGVEWVFSNSAVEMMQQLRTANNID